MTSVHIATDSAPEAEQYLRPRGAPVCHARVTTDSSDWDLKDDPGHAAH